MADVSFIIPHKGRDEMLLQTLDSIAAQQLGTTTIEVIVVSQNTEASDALLAKQKQLPLEIVFTTDGNTISHSRNIGVQHASGNYLVFLDADIELAPDWLTTMLNHIAQPQRVLVSAMQKNGQDAPPLEKIRTALSNAHLDTSVDFLPGRNLFLTRETFDQVGGFPEHLITCEDYYFTDKVGELGDLYYTSDTTYVHIGEDKSFAEMFKKEIWRGQSNLASIRGRRIRLAEWPSFFVPLVPVASLIAALLCLLLAQNQLALAALLMTFLPVVVYAGRLKRLVKAQTSLGHCVLFYLVYFPARAIGTVLGLKAELATDVHK